MVARRVRWDKEERRRRLQDIDAERPIWLLYMNDEQDIDDVILFCTFTIYYKNGTFHTWNVVLIKSIIHWMFYVCQ